MNRFLVVYKRSPRYDPLSLKKLNDTIEAPDEDTAIKYFDQQHPNCIWISIIQLPINQLTVTSRRRSTLEQYIHRQI